MEFNNIINVIYSNRVKIKVNFDQVNVRAQSKLNGFLVKNDKQEVIVVILS